MRYAIVIDKGENNYGAYASDLPGCIMIGGTVKEVKKNMVEAIQLHLHEMREDHDSIPDPRRLVEYVEIPDDPETWLEGVIDLGNNAGK